jgi:hypothetical protein
LFEKPQKRIPLARGRRWWDYIKVVLRKKVCEDINWIELTPFTGLSRSYLNTAMNLRFAKSKGFLHVPNKPNYQLFKKHPADGPL